MSDGKYFTTTKKGKQSTRAWCFAREADRSEGGEVESLVLFSFFSFVVAVIIDRSARENPWSSPLFFSPSPSPSPPLLGTRSLFFSGSVSQGNLCCCSSRPHGEKGLLFGRPAFDAGLCSRAGGRERASERAGTKKKTRPPRPPFSFSLPVSLTLATPPPLPSLTPPPPLTPQTQQHNQARSQSSKRTSAPRTAPAPRRPSRRSSRR